MSAFKVSIITPTYNSERFIEQTIISILNQTYTNWELILIDDASTDKTVEIITQFVKSNPQIYLLQNLKNSGAAVSRNKGIEAAKGHFIAFLDADDVWLPNKLEKQVEFMQKNNCDVCFSSYNLMNEAGKPLNKQIKALPRVSYQKLLKSNYIGNLTGIYNAKTLGKITSKNLRKRQDWLLWLSAIKKSGKPALGIQQPLAVYRVRETSISSNKLNLVKYNYWVYKKGLGFSVVKSVCYLMAFLFEHFFIKSKQKITLLNK
ncbi:glycosyltransferase family 2 protein [Seonamhaeicola algicola]|uniref:Glycosyltransferase family 2 protein n=1 Tax=Seonamhaeicola algicola TaxID=1719036 RepID=A0A5C7B390_9FLAO|nr:glycosyltransferase family 2 protein [Seonamhaeicola algicola]TXE13005.1 glycosyltransferase family 2 protein [Seonamhaeicola algicola]